MMLKEREAAKSAAEQIPIIQEIPVIDHEMMDKLTAENEKLKVCWLLLRTYSIKELMFVN